MAKHAKYVLITGFILWCIVFANAFNLLVVYEVLKYTWFQVTNIAVSARSFLAVGSLIISMVILARAKSKTLVVLSWSVLGLCSATIWLLAVKWNVVNYSSLIEMATFTLIFTTAFVCVSIPISSRIYSKLTTPSRAEHYFTRSTLLWIL